MSGEVYQLKPCGCGGHVPAVEYHTMRIEAGVSDIDAGTDSTDSADGLIPTFGEKGKQPSQVDLLVRLSGDVEYFHTPDGEGFATIRRDSHKETYELRSKEFRSWLSASFHSRYRKAANDKALKDVLGLLEGKAAHEGAEHPVFTRVAQHEGATYVDLGDKTWKAVRITARGWQVISDPPVKFRRPHGMFALPEPQRGGKVDELFEVLNVKDLNHQKLVVGWLLGAYTPVGPYPILELSGEQGSAKSTTSEFLKRLVDPHKAMRKAPPKDERDLAIAAKNSRAPLFDNISHLSDSMSECLCRLSTGGAYSTRQLYTDGDEVIFDYQRPLILNGINGVATKSDLLERTISIELPTIRPTERTVETELKARFEELAPRVLGALFDALAASMQNLPNVDGKDWPRLADFCKRVTAAEPALGWEEGSFLRAFRENEQSADHRALDAEETLVNALRRVLNDKKEWRGTATQLLDELFLAKTPQSLSNRLRRLAKPLRAVGLTVSFDRQGAPGTRYITIARRAE